MVGNLAPSGIAGAGMVVLYPSPSPLPRPASDVQRRDAADVCKSDPATKEKSPSKGPIANELYIL
jgi:hypothetical protein